MICCKQWKAFILSHNETDYLCIHDLKNLAKSLAEKEVQAKEFTEAISIIGPPKKDFDEFIKKCEACKFLGILFHIISLVKNLVASDREGNWDLRS